MTDEFDPLTGDPLPKTNKRETGSNSQVTTKTSPIPALGEAELASLHGMSKDTLIDLIRRVYSAGWGYGGLTGKELIETALKTKGEAYEALKLTALTLAVNASDWREFNAMATFWAEREHGKPTQAINTTVTIGLVEIMHEIAKRRKLIDVTPSSGA